MHKIKYSIQRKETKNQRSGLRKIKASKNYVIHDEPEEICSKNLKRPSHSAILAHSAIWALKVF
jgi:hypothetical protein